MLILHVFREVIPKIDNLEHHFAAAGAHDMLNVSPREWEFP